MDTLFIDNINVKTLIGINPDERLHPQLITINLAMQYDSKPAAKNDSIDDAINYAQVTTTIIEGLSDKTFNLIETLADYTATLLLKHFSIHSIKLTVIKKPADMPNVNHVGITVERHAATQS